MGNYVIRSFTVCNFRLIIKANKPRNKGDRRNPKKATNVHDNVLVGWL